jgi:hypothetical protein
MLRRRHINADPRGRSLRFLLGVAEIVRWPFERFAWALERRAIWPLRERTAGWGGPVAGAGALAALAVAAVTVGVLWPSGGNSSGPQPAARVAVATATPSPPPAEKPREPALHGVPPKFDVGDGAGAVKAASGEPSGATAEATEPETEADAQTAQSESGSPAATSSKVAVPAGPAAMKVARRFSEAFVFYEIGERPARAKTVFGETATPQLAKALADRPPRLPQDAKVPKARVVNLVPGPRSGKTYTVSVSLLRVGLTSELRLEMRQKSGSWLITDVRG